MFRLSSKSHWNDPVDGDSIESAIQQLLELDRVQDRQQTSEGAVEAAETPGQLNARIGMYEAGESP